MRPRPLLLAAAAAAAALLPGLAVCRADAPPAPPVLSPSPSASDAASDMVAEALAQVPPCAFGCLIAAMAKSPCSDAECSCSDAATQNEATACVLDACSLPEAIATKKFAQKVCNSPKRNLGPRFKAMTVGFVAVTSVLVATRLVYNHFFCSSRGRLAADDVVISLTMVLGIACTVLNVQGLAAHGLGTDIWNQTPDDITQFIRYFYLLEIFYLVLMALIKLALSLFYLSIFPGPRIRRVLWATAAFNVVVGFISVVTAIFQCTPISYYWTQFIADGEGRCINIHMLGWMHGCLNIAINVWMIALPLSQVRKLELHWKKKIGVTIMFLMGAFDTIVSILRLQSLIHFANSLNPTWDQFDVVWWSTIEINVGLICTCLPTMRLILVRLFPRALSTGVSSYHPSSAAANRASSDRGIMVHKQIRISSIDVPMVDEVVTSQAATNKAWEAGEARQENSPG